MRSENVSTENCGASFPGLVCHTVLSHWVSNTVCHSAATTRDNLYRTGGLYHSLIHEGHPSVLAQSVAWKISRMWKDLVRFPNCIVYSWVYNTQKTVKFFFDCFHSLHQAMHWYVSIRIGIFRVSSPGSNWKNFFSFTQFEVTAILLPPPNL